MLGPCIDEREMWERRTVGLLVPGMGPSLGCCACVTPVGDSVAERVKCYQTCCPAVYVILNEPEECLLNPRALRPAVVVVVYLCPLLLGCVRDYFKTIIKM